MTMDSDRLSYPPDLLWILPGREGRRTGAERLEHIATVNNVEV